jgi:hypothetical protein
VIERHFLRDFEEIIPDDLKTAQIQKLVKLDKATKIKLDKTKAELDTIKQALQVFGDIY